MTTDLTHKHAFHPIPPDAPRAAESLLKLGTSLDRLGQRDDACRTIAEVELRYPFSPIVQDARSAMLNIGCN